MQYWYIKNVPVFTNTGTFQYLGPEVYFFHRSLFRFHDENVSWISEYFLGENTVTKSGALSNKQRMDVFLQHVGDPGFQTGVGEDMGI